jgi:hypothetical protein
MNKIFKIINQSNLRFNKINQKYNKIIFLIKTIKILNLNHKITIQRIFNPIHKEIFSKIN